jgi:hypothetical protein
MGVFAIKAIAPGCDKFFNRSLVSRSRFLSSQRRYPWKSKRELQLPESHSPKPSLSPVAQTWAGRLPFLSWISARKSSTKIVI